MWLDGDKTNQPDNSCARNYNLNNYNKIGSVTNQISNKVITTFDNNPLLVIQLTNDEFIIFSQNGKVGLVSGEVYTLKYTLPFINKDNLQGHFYINNKSERIVVFKSSLGLKQLNIDSVNTDTDLFNTSVEPTIVSTLVAGGNLEVGGYSIFCRYINIDNSTTNYYKSYGTFFIPSLQNKKSGAISTQALTLNISNLDIKYKYLEIGYIRVKEGVKESFSVKKIPVTGTTATVVITGSEINIPISLTEVVENKAIYKNLNYLKVIKNNLYGLGTVEYKEKTTVQTNVNNLTFNWYSEITENPKGFAHGEVYAVYIRFKYFWGVGKWYVCKGREALSGDTNNVIIEGITDKKFRNSDTCTYIGTDGAGKKGLFSYWENENELYPLEGNFPVGKVKHFKFPTINWMRKNVYNTNVYGTLILDTIGIKLTSIDLNLFKDSDENVPYAYELGYAKRTQYNSCNLGQSISIFNEVAASDATVNPHIDKRYSIGGNYRGFNTIGTPVASDALYKKEYRTYPLEILNNLGTSNVTAFREEMLIVSDSSDILTNNTNNPFTTYKFTHTLTNFSTGTSASITEGYKPNISKTQIILNNTIRDNIDNTYSESYFSIEYATDLESLTTEDSIQLSNIKQPTVPPISGGLEYTKLITLLSGNINCYTDFNNQNVISLGIKTNNIFLNGDIFKNKFNIILYSTQKFTKRIAEPYSTKNDEQGQKEGNVFIKTFLCESVYNGNYLIDDAVKHYPNFDYSETSLYHAIRPRDTDPNLFNVSINKDYNVSNEFEFSKVFTLDTVDYIDDNYKIVRSGSAINNTIYNFREFSRDDYALLPKNKGKLISIHDNKDFIYIQCENSLFKSVTSERAAVDNTDNLLYVKVGDIFEYPFSEVMHSEFGEIGCKQLYGSGNTKYGHLVIDSTKSNIYLLSDSGLKILNQKGLINVFKGLLNSKDIKFNPFTEKSVSFVVDSEFERIIFLINNTAVTYSLVSDGWTHFDTLVPQYYFSTRDNLFSFYNNKLYLHNKLEDYNTMYGQTIQGVYSLVIKTKDKTGNYFSISGFRFKPTLLDLIKFSNSYQSSRHLNLKLMDNDLPLEKNSGNVRKYKNDYLYYHIRDSQTTDTLLDAYIEVNMVLTDSSLQEISEIEILT